MKYLAIIAISSAAFICNAADIVSGKARSSVCASCHGAHGISRNPMFPSLAGKEQSYLSEQLRGYKDGSLRNSTMNAMVTPLSSEDIENIAAYFASLSAE
ncbi:MAG: cytochrome c [Gammaproteobacteria bacterium]|nr:cytochrome c [Gammaproteobacteria bacterium]